MGVDGGWGAPSFGAAIQDRRAAPYDTAVQSGALGASEFGATV